MIFPASLEVFSLCESHSLTVVFAATDCINIIEISRKRIRCFFFSSIDACERRRRRRRRRKLSKEVCQVLPSSMHTRTHTTERERERSNELPSSSSLSLSLYSFKFVRVCTHTCLGQVYLGMRTNAYNHPRSRQDARWGFSFSHHQRRRTEHQERERERKGDGSVKSKLISRVTCKQKKRREKRRREEKMPPTSLRHMMTT